MLKQILATSALLAIVAVAASARHRRRQVPPAGRRADRSLRRPRHPEEEEVPVSGRSARQRHPDADRDGRCG